MFKKSWICLLITFLISLTFASDSAEEFTSPKIISCPQQKYVKDQNCAFSDIFLPNATIYPGSNFSFTLITKNFTESDQAKNSNNTTNFSAYLFAKQPQRSSMNFLGILLGAEYVGPVALNFSIKANSRQLIQFKIPQWIQTPGELIVVLIKDKELQGEFRVKLEKIPDDKKITKFGNLKKSPSNIVEYCEDLKKKNLLKSDSLKKLCKIADEELLLRKREFLFLGINKENDSNQIFGDFRNLRISNELINNYEKYIENRKNELEKVRKEFQEQANEDMADAIKQFPVLKKGIFPMKNIFSFTNGENNQEIMDDSEEMLLTRNLERLEQLFTNEDDDQINLEKRDLKDVQNSLIELYYGTKSNLHKRSITAGIKSCLGQNYYSLLTIGFGIWAFHSLSNGINSTANTFLVYGIAYLALMTDRFIR